MNKLKQQVQNTLKLSDEFIAPIEDEEGLLVLIERYVQELIDFDFEKLLLVLYRIDVSEQKVKDALDMNGPANAANSIAKLILEREKEKQAFREKYSDGSTDWQF